LDRNYYKKSIFIEPGEFDRMEEILSIDGGYCNEHPRDEAIKTYAAEFPGGYEADIEVVNSVPPCVKATLYQTVEENGKAILFEADNFPDTRSLEGEYWFAHDGTTFIVFVNSNRFFDRLRTKIRSLFEGPVQSPTPGGPGGTPGG